MALQAELRALERAAKPAPSGASISRWVPHEPTERQRAFLELDSREALYGGAAGGGKSDALLMGALRFADVPGYSAIIFRRTYQDLALPGALMDRAAQWLTGTGARWNGTDRQWRFPSGSTLAFGYMDCDADRHRYQGAEFQGIYFDELTQFSEMQYRYLLSRLRRTVSQDIPLHVRAASNPGGRGHDWVKARFVDPGRPDCPFISARLEDNPHLDALQYREALAQLDAVTRQQLEMGVWVRDTQGLVYPYTHINVVDERPDYGYGTWQYVLGVDLGASERKPTTAFVVLGWHTHDSVVYVLRSHLRAGMTPTTIAEEINALGRDYGFVGIVVDAGALGKGYVKEFRSRYAIPCDEAEKSSKLGYRKLVRGSLESGSLKIVATTNEQLMDEMGSLSWNAQGTDNEAQADNHLTDALLYAWRKTRSEMAKAPEAQLVPGSPEALNKEMQDLEDREEREARARARGKWWT